MPAGGGSGLPQCLRAALICGDNAVGVLGPAEGARVGVGFLHEAVDGDLESEEGVEHPAFSDETAVGVKWKTKRGCRSSQRMIFGSLCAA